MANAEPGAFQYRPHLDGLRAIAVYLVVIFHAESGMFSGGFIGVDLFFVLSGYLVTNVIISDLWSSRPISLASFYSRRVRRLLPAAAVALLGTAAVFTLVASPLEALESVDSFRAAFLYFANWHFISESSDYFADDLRSNPVLHYWSLAIEEQFYFVWPLALVGLAAIRRRAARGDLMVRAFVALLMVASALWAIRLAGSNVSRAYYGTDSRAYQLLAGALLAMSPTLVAAQLGLNARRVASVVGAIAVGAIVVLGSALIDVGPITRGVATTVTAVTALAALELASPSGFARRMLSTRSTVYLGKISYGTYLWHWPVIIVAGRLLEVSALVNAAIAAIVATALASLSSQLLELPIRNSVSLRRMPRLVAIGGVTMSALIGVILVRPVLERDLGSAKSAAPVAPQASLAPQDGDDRVVTDVDWLAASTDRALQLDCFNQPVELCLAVDGPGPRIVLLGDSHGVMMRPAFEGIAKRRGYALYVPAGNGCSWAIGLASGSQTPEQQAECYERQADWYERIIPEIDPDLVVVIQRAVDDNDRPIKMVGDSSFADDVGEPELLVATAQRTLAALEELDQPVAIIESVPVAAEDRDPLECLSEVPQGESLDNCAYVAREGKTPLEQFYASRERDGEVFVVDIDRLVCPRFPVCDPVVEGEIVKWDSTHLTTTFARLISEELEAVLDETGALP